MCSEEIKLTCSCTTKRELVFEDDFNSISGIVSLKPVLQQEESLRQQSGLCCSGNCGRGSQNWHRKSRSNALTLPTKPPLLPPANHIRVQNVHVTEQLVSADILCFHLEIYHTPVFLLRYNHLVSSQIW